YALLAGAGLLGQSGLGMIAWAIVIAGVFLGIYQYRKSEQGYMPFGEGFRQGMLITLVAGVVEAAGKFVYTKFINPGVKDQIMEATLLALEQNPQATEEVIDAAMTWTDTITSPIAISGIGFLGTLILGLIAALIAAAIFKQESPVVRPDDIG
ncbi:MAG: DUF4199 domain-containing protein, partial [Bacteroidota bacterium]